MVSELLKKTPWEITLLKILLALYILLCFLIAGLNFGAAPNASPKIQKLILTIWHFYENYIKTILILLGSWLSLRIRKKSSPLQRQNYIGLIIAAFIVHILGPLVTSNPDLYFFMMPFPWSSTALQTAFKESPFYIKYLPLWGLRTISLSLLFYGIVTAVVFTGTLFFGRRWQCSTLCLFNGFISETFSPAFPLIKSSKNRQSKFPRLLKLLKWPLLIISLFLFTFWAYSLFSGHYISELGQMLSAIEIYIYLGAELILAMLFWVFFTGRGYCYYCPLGTVLSWISRIAGQKIKTDRNKCIKCGKCNRTCPMSIEIQSLAEDKKDVSSSDCVGCGHCVDICPAKTLEYSTHMIDRLKKK